MKPTVAGILCVLTLSGISAVSVNAADYTVVDLGPGTGVAINNSGNVVRNVTNQAFFHRGNSIVPITPGQRFDQVSVADINDANVVAGFAVISTLGDAAFWWSEIETKSTGLSVETPLRVWALNSAGFAVGVNLGDFRSPRYSPAGGQFIPDFQFNGQGKGFGGLLDVNDAGVAVGFLAARGSAFPFSTVRPRAAKVDQGVVTYLDTRSPGEPIYFVDNPATRLSEAYAINEAGAIVGRMALEPDGPKHAFRYLGQGMEDLGTLGGLESEAFEVNDSGLIVGRAQLSNGEWRAMIYENGTMIDLNTRLPAGMNLVLTQAKGINNVGQILADALIDGATNAVRLSPPGPPQITSQPQPQTVAIGETVTLSVSATGGLPLTYQWWKGTEPLSGEINQSLVLPQVNAFSQGTYRVEVSNAGGSASSETVTVTVLDPELTPYTMAALAVVGEVGGSYRIDFKPRANSIDWQPLETIRLTNNPQWYIDLASATNRMRIYRAVRVP